MKQYLELLDRILCEGTKKPPARQNVPPTIGINFATISHDLSQGFPLLTTKKMYLKGIICELLWFLKGDTNIKYLVDNNVHIWDVNAYRWFEKHCTKRNILKFPQEQFIEVIKATTDLSYFSDYSLGDLGKVYGHQWRNFNGVDQVKNIYNSLKKSPYSRYHLLNAWNPAELSEMALPPCHLLYQFICREEMYGIYLDLNMYQRSCDYFLGVPFNIASMALFLLIMARAVGYIPGKINWAGGDVHLYQSHIPMAKKQLERTPGILPEIQMNKLFFDFSDIETLQLSDFRLMNYDPAPAISAELYG